MMALFPVDFYECLDSNTVAQSPQSNLHVTQNAIGLPQYRPKQSSRVIQYNGLTYAVNVTQYANFRAWVDNDLRFGSLPFDMVDPVDGLTKSFKLVNGTFQARSIGRNIWQIKLTVECLQ